MLTPNALPKNHLRLWLKLLKATTAIEDELRARFKRQFNTTLPRFDVMSALYRYPEGLAMSRISELLKVSGGNVTPVVERLCADGWVERLPVEGDRRVSLVRLSEAGVAHFAVQAAAHQAWIDELLDPLDNQQTQQWLLLLEVLSQNIETQHQVQA